MGLKKAENQVKIMLADTIMAMCRNTLNYHGEVCVEGLLGITLDKEEIFLVSINQTITNPEVLQQKAEIEASRPQTDRKRRSSEDESSDSDSSDSQSNTEGTDEQKQKKSRRKRRKRKTSSQSSGDSSDSDNNGENGEKSLDQENRSQKSHDNGDNESNVSGSSNNPLIPTGFSTPMRQFIPNLSGLIPGHIPGQPVMVKQEKTEDDDDLIVVKGEESNNSSVSQQYSDFVAAGAAAQFPPFGQFNLSASDGSNPFHNTSLQFLATQQQVSPDGSIPQPGPSAQDEDAYLVAASSYFEELAKQARNKLKSSSEGKSNPCGVCGKQFAFPSLLNRHMLVHTGEKNHICRFCGTNFSQKASLTAHQKHCKMRVDVNTTLNTSTNSNNSQ